MAIQGVRLASSNYLATAASTWFQPGRTLTVMCWARPGTLPPTSNYYTLLGTTTSAGVSGWGMSIQGAAGSTAFWEMFFTNNGSNYDDFRFTNAVASGRWDHVAWVMRSDATEAGYLNGKQETLVQASNAGTYPAAASRTLQIKWGDATGNGTFDGALAYVRIFDGELSGAEIRAEMFARRAVNRRLHVICDIPLETPGGTTSIVAPDYGPQGLHVTTVTGTVTWDRSPPLPALPSTVLQQTRWLTVPGGAAPVTLGQAVETDTATALGRVKSRAIAQATETDTATALTRLKIRALTQAVETDTATALTRVKLRALSQATETDTATVLGRTKRLTLGQSAETDIAGTFTLAGGPVILGQAIETDSATAITRLKLRAIGQATETDAAQAIGRVKLRQLGQAVELDTATALVGAGVGLAGEAHGPESLPTGAITSRSTALAGGVT